MEREWEIERKKERVGMRGNNAMYNGERRRKRE